MSDPAKSLRDVFLHTLHDALEHSAVTSATRLREQWQRGECVITGHLEAAKREREAAEAEIRLLTDKETETFDLLVNTFSFLSLDDVRLAWERQGDLVPPRMRQMLSELGDATHAPPGLVLSPAETGSPQQTSQPQDSGGTEAQDDSTLAGSGPLAIDPSSSKRPADSASTPAELASNKRARIFNDAYTYRPSDIAGSPSPQKYRGTVQLFEVDGLHWAFKSPVTGPGYYVLLCNEGESEKDAYQFQNDPWQRNRALKHYTRAMSCHDEYFDPRSRVVTQETIMRRFGYLVEDMTEETFLSSNQHIQDLRDEAASKKKQKTSYKKGPEFHTIHRSPPPASSPPPGQAPIPNMWPYTHGSAMSTAEDDLEHVISDLY